MARTAYVFVAIAGFVGTAVTVEAADPWLRADRYGDVVMVQRANATETEGLAAEAFQRYWQKTAGHSPRIVGDGGKGVCVYIGRSSIPGALLRAVDLDGLGEDAVCIRTFPGPEASDGDGDEVLLITGGSDGGALYAVYEFFERFMGVRWLTSDVTYVPPEPPAELPEIDYTFDPPFIYRDVYMPPNLSSQPTEFSRANRLSDRRVQGPFGGHTFYHVLPPDRYFEAHPEYYSLVNGRRIAMRGNWADPKVHERQLDQRGQLCCSNPAVAKACVERLAMMIRTPASEMDEQTRRDWAFIRGHPSGKVLGLSQMDWFGPCECDQCRAIDEREGSHAGSLLTLVNRVAEGIEAEFPNEGYQIHTFAYQYSRKAPRELRPRANVIIQLCSIECDFGRPLDDPSSPVNWAFLSDLKGWSRLTHNLYVWDYVPNFAGGQRPHPNLHVLGPNIQLFARYGVKGVFEQGLHGPATPFAEFRPLRFYILARCLWNPALDGDAVAREFIRLYYGEAGPYIQKYVDLMRARIEKADTHLGCFAPPDWLDYDTVAAAQKLFEQAVEAVRDDAELRKRVEIARIPVQYAALVCPPKVERDGDRLVFDRPACMTLEEHVATIERFGFKVYEPYSLELDVREEVGHKTPPRHRETPLVVLENDHASVWITPEEGGSVVRWHDKRRGLDLLRARVNARDEWAGTWQDWAHDAFGPVAARYEVLAHSSDAVTLRAELDNGLVLARRMRLAPDADALFVDYDLHNPTDRAISFRLKVHPEFDGYELTVPAVWVDGPTGWERFALDAPEFPQLPYTGARPAEGARRWAYHIPARRVTVVNEFDASQVGLLRVFALASEQAQQINLELITPDVAIAPGEHRSLALRYWVTDQRPAAIE